MSYIFFYLNEYYFRELQTKVKFRSNEQNLKKKNNQTH